MRTLSYNNTYLAFSFRPLRFAAEVRFSRLGQCVTQHWHREQSTLTEIPGKTRPESISGCFKPCMRLRVFSRVSPNSFPDSRDFRFPKLFEVFYNHSRYTVPDANRGTRFLFSGIIPEHFFRIVVNNFSHYCCTLSSRSTT